MFGKMANVFCSFFSLPGDENKTNGGSVEALREHPFDSSKVMLILKIFYSNYQLR